MEFKIKLMVMDTTAGKLAKQNAEMENASYQLGQMNANLQIAWKQFAAGLGPIGAVADALGPSMLQGAITGLMMNLPALSGALQSLGGVLVGLGPAGWAVGAAIAGVTALYVAYQTNFMGMRDIVDNAVAEIQNILGGLSNAVQSAWESITSTLGGIGAGIAKGAEELWRTLTGGAAPMAPLTPPVVGGLVGTLGAAAGPSVNVTVDVHDNKVGSDEELAENIQSQMIDALRMYGVIP